MLPATGRLPLHGFDVFPNTLRLCPLISQGLKLQTRMLRYSFRHGLKAP